VDVNATYSTGAAEFQRSYPPILYENRIMAQNFMNMNSNKQIFFGHKFGCTTAYDCQQMNKAKFIQEINNL
jgi:hypothetical protein